MAVVAKTWTVADYVSSELDIDPNVSRVIVELFEDGHEIPFIARYRRHITMGATPDDLRHVLKAFNEAKALKAKAEKYIKQIDSEVKAPDYQKKNLKLALSKTMDEEELDSLFAPFKKSKKNTLAAIAAELGVGPICEKILRGEYVNFEDYIDKSRSGLETRAKVETAVLNYLSCDFHRMEETQALLQTIVNNPGILRDFHLRFTVVASLTAKGKKKKKEGEERKKNRQPLDDSPDAFYRFERYEKFTKPLEFVKEYQILGLERAALRGIISWDVKVDGRLSQMHPARELRVHPAHSAFLGTIITNSVKQFFIPSVQRTLRRRLLDKAESSAVDCFANNLRELLMTAPLKGRPILAIDPGYKAGCKCALIDEYGRLIDSAVIHPRKIGDKWELGNAECTLVSLVANSKSDAVIIAIGNGSGSFTVENSVASLIQRGAFRPKNVEFCIISECGSSVYSASPLADVEFPNLEITLRSAVSIARRVLDPISEYVKIEPKHLGVGSYQHSVKAKRLDEMLDLVVRECVSNVGVDVNVASVQVLQKVAGLNKRTAEGIVKYREENGRIINRETLKAVKGIGPKSFEQCAGFLFVFDDGEQPSGGPVKRRRIVKSRNPLDATPVHPESYHVAEKLLSKLKLDISDIGTEAFRQKLLSAKYVFESPDENVELVCELLCKETLTCNPPKLLKSAREIGPIVAGRTVEGVVMNHTQFGAFIDIGIGFNGLLHVSCFGSEDPPRVNSRIQVIIKEVNMEAKRISLLPVHVLVEAPKRTGIVKYRDFFAKSKTGLKAF